MNLHNQTTTNIQEKSSLIWAIADKLRSVYKPHEYGKVILPMTVIKRFDDVLSPTKQTVLATYAEKKNIAIKDPFLTKASGYSFYNTSPYDFKKLLDDSENIEKNFKAYLNGFSENVIDILKNFKFDNEISRLAENNLLYLVIEEFNKPNAYMGVDKITPVDMGYIFEDLIRLFSESYNENAGAHFTSRDIIYLMTDLLTTNNENLTSSVTVYDMTMGTSQMLTCMTERLKDINSKINVAVYGQELNAETYAIAKADMLIRGGDSDNMRLGNTLSDDKFSGYTFNYIISNPPFGVEWKVEEKFVKEEAKQGINGRFGVGLPRKSDGQMLFDLNGIAKLKDNGRMAIIHNGSSLFTGDAGSGESEIRRFIIENDYLDAIVQLPSGCFYNTGINTYIWLITKQKPVHRQGKVQLINASEIYESRRKNIGEKRVDITDNCRELIVQVYKDFQAKDYSFNDKVCGSKIFNNLDFGFTKIQIESPLYDAQGNIVTKGKKDPKTLADKEKQDFENVPLAEDIEEYFQREVKPYNPDAWIEHSKSKIGYEIPFNRYFYKFTPPEDSELIASRIKQNEAELMQILEQIFTTK